MGTANDSVGSDLEVCALVSLDGDDPLPALDLAYWKRMKAQIRLLVFSISTKRKATGISSHMPRQCS